MRLVALIALAGRLPGEPHPFSVLFNAYSYISICLVNFSRHLYPSECILTCQWARKVWGTLCKLWTLSTSVIESKWNWFLRVGSALACAGTPSNHNVNNERVIGGHDAQPNSWRWQVRTKPCFAHTVYVKSILTSPTLYCVVIWANFKRECFSVLYLYLLPNETTRSTIALVHFQHTSIYFVRLMRPLYIWIEACELSLYQSPSVSRSRFLSKWTYTMTVCFTMSVEALLSIPFMSSRLPIAF